MEEKIEESISKNRIPTNAVARILGCLLVFLMTFGIGFFVNKIAVAWIEVCLVLVSLALGFRVSYLEDWDGEDPILFSKSEKLFLITFASFFLVGAGDAISSTTSTLDTVLIWIFVVGTLILAVVGFVFAILVVTDDTNKYGHLRVPLGIICFVLLGIIAAVIIAAF
jgi:hypothetical protein